MRKSVKLDRLDLKILDVLVQDGRISKAALGDQVGLSPTPCFERIKKMEYANIISGYHATIDLPQLDDIVFIIAMIEILDYTQEKAKLFKDQVLKMPEVIGAQTVLGNYDFVLQIAARNIDHYQRILQKILDNDDFEIDYRSFPVTETFKTPDALSLLPLLESIADDREALSKTTRDGA